MRKDRKSVVQRNPSELTLSKDMGRRRYKLEFIRFLTYAHASCDETIDHLETLHETGSLSDDPLYERLHQKLNQLGGKLNQFIRGVELQHHSVREDSTEYTRDEEE